MYDFFDTRNTSVQMSIVLLSQCLIVTHLNLKHDLGNNRSEFTFASNAIHYYMSIKRNGNQENNSNETMQ